MAYPRRVNPIIQKKTVWPKRPAVSVIDMVCVKGKIARIRRDVIAQGIGCRIHHVTCQASVPNAICPAAENPSMPNDQISRKTAGPARSFNVRTNRRNRWLFAVSMFVSSWAKSTRIL